MEEADCASEYVKLVLEWVFARPMEEADCASEYVKLVREWVYARPMEEADCALEYAKDGKWVFAQHSSEDLMKL